MSQPDLSQLFAKAQEMQSRLAKVQQELARRTVEVSSGGGMVTVVASGPMSALNTCSDGSSRSTITS